MSTDTLTGLDLDTFLKELEEYDSAKCESEHTTYNSAGVTIDRYPCTIDAVARAQRTCVPASTLWCQARLDKFLRVSEYNGCVACKRTQAECWVVYPI